MDHDTARPARIGLISVGLALVVAGTTVAIFSETVTEAIGYPGDTLGGLAVLAGAGIAYWAGRR